jgi:hypothetical protein
MLDDPRVNFSISSRGAHKGVDHLGIQVDDDTELAIIARRLAEAGQSTFEQTVTTCCYAKSNKAWVHDPEGVAWESFHTLDDSTIYGEDRTVGEVNESKSSACCTPAKEQTKAFSCCAPAAV